MSATALADLPPPPAARRTREFLAPIHAFRGFAIAMVIGAHSWAWLMFTFGAIVGDRGWPAFFRSKLLNVAVPYLVVSALFSLYPSDPVTFRLMPFSGSWADYLAQLGTNLVTGGAFFHL